MLPLINLTLNWSTCVQFPESPWTNQTLSSATQTHQTAAIIPAWSRPSWNTSPPRLAWWWWVWAHLKRSSFQPLYNAFAQCLCVCSKTAQIPPQTWSCQTHTSAASGSVGSPATATTTPSQVRAIQGNQAFSFQFLSFIAHVLCCRLFSAVRWWWLVAREVEKPVAVSREPQFCHAASLTFHLLRVQGHRNQWNRNESPESSINALSEQRCTCVCFSFHTFMPPKIQQSIRSKNTII